MSAGFGRRGPSKRVMTREDEALFRYRVALRIKCLRKNLGLTQDQLAAHLGVTQGRINGLESGRALPLAHDLPALCRALNTDPNTLLEFNE